MSPLYDSPGPPEAFLDGLDVSHVSGVSSLLHLNIGDMSRGDASSKHSSSAMSVIADAIVPDLTVPLGVPKASSWKHGDPGLVELRDRLTPHKWPRLVSHRRIALCLAV